MLDFGTRSESELDPLPVVLFAFCCDGARLLFVRCDVLCSWSNDVLAQTIIISRACLRPPQSAKRVISLMRSKEQKQYSLDD